MTKQDTTLTVNVTISYSADAEHIREKAQELAAIVTNLKLLANRKQKDIDQKIKDELEEEYVPDPYDEL